MRKSMLAIAAAGSIFALTAAGATGLDVANTQASVPVQNSGGAVAITASACNDTFTVTYNVNTSAQITGAVINDTSGTPSSACLGAAVALSIDGGAATLWSGTLNATTGDALLSGTPVEVANETSITTHLLIG